MTVLFADVAGSTALVRELDPEDTQALLDDALQRFTSIVSTHRGRVLQYAGDSILAVFGGDKSHEDDAELPLRRSAMLAEAGGFRELNARTWGVPGSSRSQLLVYAVIAVAVILIGARWDPLRAERLRGRCRAQLRSGLAPTRPRRARTWSCTLRAPSRARASTACRPARG